MMINNINTYWSFQIYSNLQKYKLNKSTYFINPPQGLSRPTKRSLPNMKLMLRAILFEREKQLRETLEEVRQKLESIIHSFELTNRNFEDFLNLQELLYEFYPIR